MFMKLSWEANFILFSKFILSVIKICNEKYGKDANAEKEAKISKAWNVCQISGITCRVKRLEGGDAFTAFWAFTAF